MLENYENYFVYDVLAKKRFQTIKTSEINVDNWNNHIDGIVNILRDGIETEYVQSMFIKVVFEDGISVELSIFDYFFNLIMWHCIIKAGGKIFSRHLFFPDDITQDKIKDYIDNNFIDVYRKANFNGLNSPEEINIALNNMIDSTLHPFMLIDIFAFYLANTINMEDTIDLMNSSKEFYDLMNLDFSNVPLEEVKERGEKATARVIDIIKNSDHCLADSFRAQEGVNPKQFREFSVNMGIKPDGKGGIFPAIINNSLLNGGMNDIISAYIESSSGRIAQIIAKMNVGKSGHFARILGLNNRDTTLYPDRNYVCNTMNFVQVEIKSPKMLKWFNNRYYRNDKNGLEYKIDYKKDKNLIGKKILLRSPITCASHARGEGICYRCYGDLAYTNCNINIGQLAATLMSAALTQRLLSAKHLLEAFIVALKWCPDFFLFFDVDCNIIKLNDDMDYKGYTLIIDPDDICIESEEDDFEYNEYVTQIQIRDPEGNIHNIYTEDRDSLYIINSLNDAIRDYGKPVDEKIELDMEKIETPDVFMIYINNNELSRTLELIKSIINKKAITESFDINEITQKFIETVIEGGLSTIAVHLELILSNQIRSKEDYLEKPDWTCPNQDYKIITLNDALTNNPSITVCMEYQKLAKVLYNPLSYNKNKPSFLDLLFMTRPQEFIMNRELIDTEYKPKSDRDPINLITWDNKKN